MTIREWMQQVRKQVAHVESFDLQLLLSQRLDLPRALLLAHLDDELTNCRIAFAVPAVCICFVQAEASWSFFRNNFPAAGISALFFRLP